MVSQATVQGKVNKGFAIASAKVGQPVQWYRATDTTSPIAPAHLRGTLQVLFDTSASLSQATPRTRDKPENWYAAFDTTGVQIGDYFITTTPETYFVSVMDALRPARLVLCNDIVTMKRAGDEKQVGYNPAYGGDNTANETTLATGWPCAIIEGMKGEPGDTRLPGDVKLPWQTILLPAVPALVLRNDDIVIDQNLQRHVLSQVELTKLGWRALSILETA